jgi:translation initiation factor RLI1
VKGKVDKVLKAKDQRGLKDTMQYTLDLDHLMEREIAQLSGGEL